MLRVDGGLSSLLAVALGSESRLVHFIIHFIMTGQAFFFFEPNVRALGLALVRRKSTDNNGNSDISKANQRTIVGILIEREACLHRVRTCDL